MKKLLALVLALVMSMFIVTISNAAFSDAADIDYKEAVDVLAAVGVLEGPDGKFDPKAELTREQAAKIIAYLDLGIRMNKISFEDADMQDDGEQINTYDMSYEFQDLQSVANVDRFPLEERDEAAEQLEQLAEDGDAYAQYIIGTAYRDGGLLIPDTVKAQKLLECAAEQDLDAAQYALGKLYLSDDADIHDPAKGIYWLKRSADNGNDFAAYRLGREYFSGVHAAKNAETAAFYLERAANDGNAYAQYLLGKLYLMGEGVPKDTDTAYEWFSEAERNGHAYAGFFLKRMERGEQEPPSALLSGTRLLYHMGNIFRDNAPAPAADGVQIDRKRLAQLRQKRVALGHKPDDHELEQQQGFSMKFHM